MIDKIMKRIAIDESGCWLWQGAKNDRGYGQIRIKGEPYYVHRIMWESYNGAIPEGINICHHCDTPACCNPHHLFPGTRKDNLHDASLKGRVERGERHHNSKLTEKEVLVIREDNRVHRTIAKDYSMSQQQITDIKNKKCWAWL